MKITNKLGLPQALADAVMNDPYENGGAWRSVTQLIAPPRQVVLKKRHDHEIEEDCSDRLYALYGQIVHQILERANTQDLVEQRLFTTEKGKLISGGYDVLQLTNGRLSDWKFSTFYKTMGDNEDWEAQVNLLALLFRRQGTDIRELEIVLLMRDHSKSKARREEAYPEHPAKRMPMRLWSNLEQDSYLEKRVQLHLEAEDKLPLCSAKERWARPDIYAVMKKGRKSAVKLCDDKTTADGLLKEDPERYLEIRYGESIRCLSYCAASLFCSQFKGEIKNVETK